jgi:hypothetical protein
LRSIAHTVERSHTVLPVRVRTPRSDSYRAISPIDTPSST